MNYTFERLALNIERNGSAIGSRRSRLGFENSGSAGQIDVYQSRSFEELALEVGEFVSTASDYTPQRRSLAIGERFD
jgi:hypothetical protein